MNHIEDLGIIKYLNYLKSTNSLTIENLKEIFGEDLIRIMPLISVNKDNQLSLYDFHNKRILRDEVFKKVKRCLYGKNILFIDNCYQLYRHFVKDPEFNCHYMIVNSKEEAENINKDMKIDVVIMNPPYGENGTDLHLAITDIVKTIADTTICIMPHRIIFSTNDKYNYYRNKWTDLKSVIYVDPSIFGEGCKIDNGIGIFEFHKSESFKYVNYKDKNDNLNKVDLKNISPFNDYERTICSAMYNENPNCNSFGRSIDKNNLESSIDSYLKRFKEDSYFVTSNKAGSGNGIIASGKSGVIYNSKNELRNFLISNHKRRVISEFNSRIAAENYLAAIKRPLLRFTVYRIQDDQNLNNRVYRYIPGIDWTDERSKTDIGILEMCGVSTVEAIKFAEYTKNIIDNI